MLWTLSIALFLVLVITAILILVSTRSEPECSETSEILPKPSPALVLSSPDENLQQVISQMEIQKMHIRAMTFQDHMNRNTINFAEYLARIETKVTPEELFLFTCQELPKEPGEIRECTALVGRCYVTGIVLRIDADDCRVFHSVDEAKGYRMLLGLRDPSEPTPEQVRADRKIEQLMMNMPPHQGNLTQITKVLDEDLPFLDTKELLAILKGKK